MPAGDGLGKEGEVRVLMLPFTRKERVFRKAEKEMGKVSGFRNKATMRQTWPGYTWGFLLCIVLPQSYIAYSWTIIKVHSRPNKDGDEQFPFFNGHTELSARFVMSN